MLPTSSSGALLLLVLLSGCRLDTAPICAKSHDVDVEVLMSDDSDGGD